MFYIVCCVVAK